MEEELVGESPAPRLPDHVWRNYVCWDAVLKQVGTATDLTSTEKEGVCEAVAFLRAELGEGYPRRLWEAERRPQFLTNHAAWTRKLLIHEAAALRAAKPLEGYDRLRKRLRDGQKAGEAWAVLLLADRFRRAGHAVAFEPEVVVNRRKKYPDLRVDWAGRDQTSFVEATSLQVSDGEKCAERASEIIRDAAWRRGLEPSAEVLRRLDESELQELEVAMGATAAMVAADGVFRTVEKEGAWRVGLSSERDDTQHVEWARARDLQPGGMATIIQANPIGRLTRRLVDKQWQLPRTGDHVVVVTAPAFPFVHGQLDTLLDALKSYLSAWPHVAACVIAGSNLGGWNEGTIQFGRDLLVLRTEADVVSQTFLIVANRASPGHAAIVDLLRACFGA